MDNIYRLNRVASILNSIGIRWWIDHGTLLGVLREQRLLPWDHDIDLSIFAEDLDRCFESLWKSKTFLHAHLVHTSRNIKILPYKKRGKEIDISAYFHYNGGLFAKKLVMFPRNTNLRFKKLRVLSWRQARRAELMLRVLDPIITDKNQIIKKIFGPSHLFGYNMVVKIREAMGIKATSIVPERYFSSWQLINWRDISLPIPKNPKAYLTYRYGDDWKSPKQNWTWWNDDCSLE